MKRVPEPDLMDEAEQAAAYAGADFSEPHDRFVGLFQERFPLGAAEFRALDLGCGPADVTIRFARAHPHARILAVDGANAMLQLGRRAVRAAGLSPRISFVHAYLPAGDIPVVAYDAIISNSLLHHLVDPCTLWTTVRRHGSAGTRVFIMDLLRPASVEAARALVDELAANEPEILQRDFYHSLLAAYRMDEIEAQLRVAELPLRVEQVSDRHFIAFGVLC